MEKINRDAIGGLVGRGGCAALIIAIVALIITALI
jgi:hypothetical protein